MTEAQHGEALTPTSITNALPAASLDDIAAKSPQYAALRPTQQTILIAVMEDFMSGNIRPDTIMAVDLGVDRKTIYNCRMNSAFNGVLAQLMPELVKAKLPKYLLRIENHGEKDYKALEFLLKYAGLYVQKSQSMNISASISQTATSGSPKEAIIASCQKFMGIGYDLDRYIAEITAEWAQLKTEGV